MAMFKKKPEIVEAITFDELVAYGKSKDANIINGMPWSFQYKGYPTTHENDNCYLINTSERTIRFNRGDWLITGVKNDIYVYKPDAFKEIFEPIT